MFALAHCESKRKETNHMSHKLKNAQIIFVHEAYFNNAIKKDIHSLNAKITSA